MSGQFVVHGSEVVFESSCRRAHRQSTPDDGSYVNREQQRMVGRCLHDRDANGMLLQSGWLAGTAQVRRMRNCRFLSRQ